MLLASAKVGPFKSIEAPQTVKIENKVTVFVGMNESGKTVFLKALEKSNDVLGLEKFVILDDYPRKNLTAFQRKDPSGAGTVCTMFTYRLSKSEITSLDAEVNVSVPDGFEFTISHHYDNTQFIGISVDEAPVIARLAQGADLSDEFRSAIKSASSLLDILQKIDGLSPTDADKAFKTKLTERIGAAKDNWDSVVSYEIWTWLSPRVPKFLYFGDYELLPSKTNLLDLSAKFNKTNNPPVPLTQEDRGVLALLRMAGIPVADFANPGGTESLIARIEAVSITLTDQIMEFWKQNEDLEVKIDIRPDVNDVAPYNNGPNLYIRIANNRHRGVTTPFKQRSRGFIWFFSFLVWFDSVQQQLEASKDKGRPLILLLDEPGLSLHAMAQNDFLKYIDKLSNLHQVLYTTHSPFMIHSDRLNEVRVVEDKEKIGTTISENVSESDSRTVFPLQAALGWTIAQNLFISERNLLVEGPADLVYLKAVSAMLEADGREGLRGDITIVPTGGLDKVVSFVALLGANGLKLAVLHDYRGTPEQRLLDLMRQKMISAKAVMDVSQFRNLTKLGVSGQPTDLEDLFDLSLYLSYFNRAFAKQLGTGLVRESDLPSGDRVINRIERHLITSGIQLRPSGGFNHYTPASAFASSPPSSLSTNTLGRFEALFRAVNAVF
jgi:AAA ATPase domain